MSPIPMGLEMGGPTQLPPVIGPLGMGLPIGELQLIPWWPCMGLPLLHSIGLPDDCPIAFMTGPRGLPTDGLLFMGWFMGLLWGGPQLIIPPELHTMGLLWGPRGLPMPGPQFMGPQLFMGPQFMGPMGLPMGGPQLMGLPPI